MSVPVNKGSLRKCHKHGKRRAKTHHTGKAAQWCIELTSVMRGVWKACSPCISAMTAAKPRERLICHVRWEVDGHDEVHSLPPKSHPRKEAFQNRTRRLRLIWRGETSRAVKQTEGNSLDRSFAGLRLPLWISLVF